MPTISCSSSPSTSPASLSGSLTKVHYVYDQGKLAKRSADDKSCSWSTEKKEGVVTDGKPKTTGRRSGGILCGIFDYSRNVVSLSFYIRQYSFDYQIRKASP